MRMPVSSDERVLAQLIAHGPLQRAELARRLDVSRATITNITRPLLDAGLIELAPVEPTRRRQPVRIAQRAGLLASILVTRFHVTASIACLDGRDVRTRVVDTPNQADSRDRVRQGAELVRSLLSQWGEDGQAPPLRLCHVAVPTQCDAHTGRVFPSPASQAWIGVNPLDLIGQELGCCVMVQNTARLIGYAEHLDYRRRTGSSPQSTCYVYLSDGCASGYVIGDAIASGANGGSGELGHTVVVPHGRPCECGNHGCLMQYASIPALEKALERLDRDDSVMDVLNRTASQLPDDLADVLREAGYLAGLAVANLANLLDPQLMVLGGELGHSHGVFTDELLTTAKRNTLPLVSTTMTVIQEQVADDLPTVAEAAFALMGADPYTVAGLCSDLLNSHGNK